MKNKVFKYMTKLLYDTTKMWRDYPYTLFKGFTWDWFFDTYIPQHIERMLYMNCVSRTDSFTKEQEEFLRKEIVRVKKELIKNE